MATFGDRMIAEAGKWLGTTYAWGGGTTEGPSLGIRDGGTADRFKDFTKVGFDCSGLVLRCAYVASDGTMKLPHLADLQRRLGSEVQKGQEQPGDLIAFSSNGGFSYHHIGIYIGGGMLRNAPQSGDVVKDSPVSNWANEKWAIRRLGEPGSSVGGTTSFVSQGQSNEPSSSSALSNVPAYLVLGGLVVVGLVIAFSLTN